jgi:hypothetical protein
MYNNGNSSKNVTGASVVDGTMESADYADNGLSGDKIDGGIISNFQSTGIDDRLPTGKILTLSTTGIDVTGSVTCDGLTVDSGGARAYLNTSQVRLSDGYNLEWGGGTNYIRGSNASNNLILATNGVERMQIESTGDVLVGAGNTSGGAFQVRSTGSGRLISTQSATTSNQYHNTFLNNSGSLVGTINVGTSSTAYNTSSDYRLKENVVPMTGSIDRIKALKPSKFNFIADATTTVDGFLAHEAGEVVPECATGIKDAMMTEEYEVTPAVMDGETVVTEAVMGTRSVPDYQGIDQSKIVPLLVAALQEAIARIEVLETP